MHNDLQFEKDFCGDCCNTFGEDQKHYIYGNLMIQTVLSRITPTEAFQQNVM